MRSVNFNAKIWLNDSQGKNLFRVDSVFSSVVTAYTYYLQLYTDSMYYTSNGIIPFSVSNLWPLEIWMQESTGAMRSGSTLKDQL